MSEPIRTNEPFRPELRTLPAVGEALRAGWLLLVVGLVLGVVAGAVVAGLSPATYRATATARVGSGLTAIGDFGADALWADDQVAFARTTPVREAIAEAISDATGDTVTAKVVTRRLTVLAEEKSNYLQFIWTAGTQAEAEEGADLAAQAYVEVAGDEAEAQWETHDQQLAGLIAASDPDDPRLDTLLQERTELQEIVIDPGKLAGSADGTARKTSLAGYAGGVAGLVLGAGAAYVWFLRRVRGGDADA